MSEQRGGGELGEGFSKDKMTSDSYDSVSALLRVNSAAESRWGTGRKLVHTV